MTREANSTGGGEAMLPAGRGVANPVNDTGVPPPMGVSTIIGVASVSRFPVFRTPTETTSSPGDRRAPSEGRVSE
ncbi:MAG: Uncharacterised protein [Marine Group II euryarchaeote MED-G33]|nr:MAG: Uncharacterised protein [Marine Group II euryarchaeote MED-G33]